MRAQARGGHGGGQGGESGGGGPDSGNAPAALSALAFCPRPTRAVCVVGAWHSAKVKKANPKLDHKEAFKQAASGWATSKDNPKNK